MQKTTETLSVGTTASIAMAVPRMGASGRSDRTGCRDGAIKKPSGAIGPEGHIASFRLTGPAVADGERPVHRKHNFCPAVVNRAGEKIGCDPCRLVVG